MKSLIFSIFILAAAASSLWAEDITFEASISSPRVALDEALQLTLTFTGVNADLDPVNLPVLDGFSAKYMGPSTSVSIVNGNYHSERSLIYNLFPNKVGKFQIPAISVNIGGQSYTSKPIDVEVFSNSAQAQAADGNNDQNAAPSAAALKDKILIMVSVDKTRVYLNERVSLLIKLLVNSVPVRDIQYPQFDKTGFAADDFDKPVQSSQLVNGLNYDTVEFRTNIYPNHLGDLIIGPIQIQGNLVYKTGESNPFNQDNNFFGSDVFNNVFDSYATRPITVSSQPITLHVSPLPTEGRPNDFSGALGQSFDFQANVSPTQVKSGDPLTLKMSIKGDGNFKSFRVPEFKAPGFKTYEPQIKGTNEEKTAEQVLIPITTSLKEVPAIKFSYFDTSTHSYKTITQGPFPIEVAPPSPDEDFKAVGFTDISHEPVVTQSSWHISFWKIIHRIYSLLEKLSKYMWFWAAIGIIFISGLGYSLWRSFLERLETDPAFARRLKAVREARKALLPAEGYIAQGKSKDLYALIARVLRDYLANKWHQSSAALSAEKIVLKLKYSSLDENTIAQVRSILEQSDLVCFAGATFDAPQMQADLQTLRNLIVRLEKALK